jgi:alpha-1,6-mannosyltransferase
VAWQWRLALVCLGGGVLEAACLWIWSHSAHLTAIYNADYTRAFFAVLPWLAKFSAGGEPDADAASLAREVVIGLLIMSLGYSIGLIGLDLPKSYPSPDKSMTWLVIGFAAAFRMTLAWLPGLFSTDIFSYVMYGRIAGINAANPYVLPPSAFEDDPFLGWVFPFWRDQPTEYGPLWTDLSAVLARLTADRGALEQVLIYRAAIIGFEALTLGLLWWLLGRLHPLGRDRGLRLQAWMLFAWNPLVLFDLVGSTHNDAAMLALLLLGLAFIVRGRTLGWLTGLALLSLSALVKYATVVVLGVMTVTWAGEAGSSRQRLARLAAGVGLPLVLAVLLWGPWVRAPSAFDVLGQAAGGRLVLNSAPDVVALTLADQVLVPNGEAVDVAKDSARFWMRLATRVAFIFYFGWELLRVWRQRQPTDLLPSIAASARLLLVLPLVVFTWVWSWYLSWCLSLAALLGWQSRLARLAVAYTLVGPPVVYAHQYLDDQLSGVFVLAMALLPLPVLVPVRRLLSF